MRGAAMSAIRLAIPTTELVTRMRDRLRGLSTAPLPPRVVWQRGAQRAILHLDSLTLRALDGWLLVGLDMQTDPTGRQNIQVVYHLGADGESDGLAASAT